MIKLILTFFFRARQQDIVTIHSRRLTYAHGNIYIYIYAVNFTRMVAHFFLLLQSQKLSGFKLGTVKGWQCFKKGLKKKVFLINLINIIYFF